MSFVIKRFTNLRLYLLPFPLTRSVTRQRDHVTPACIHVCIVSEMADGRDLTVDVSQSLLVGDSSDSLLIDGHTTTDDVRIYI